MKAMVLAAGLGTRLRPMTNDRPKALVELGGRTLLEIALARLKSFGVTEVIINVHHFADMVVEYLRSRGNFGLRIEISREEELLDTGGGLQRAGWFFREGGEEQPFILYNVDVISTIDLAEMVREHQSRAALATLAVQKRSSSRQLLFDGELLLCGRRKSSDAPEVLNGAGDYSAFGFCGIHVISPRLLTMMSERGAFSIIDVYLRLAGMGARIVAFRADQYYWRDLGKPESLASAETEIRQKLVT